MTLNTQNAYAIASNQKLICYEHNGKLIRWLSGVVLRTSDSRLLVAGSNPGGYF